MRQNTKGSILIISHQERILNIADEIVVIADGKIVNQGTRDEIMPKIMGNGFCSGCLLRFPLIPCSKGGHEDGSDRREIIRGSG